MRIGPRKTTASYHPPLVLPAAKSTFQTLTHSGSVLSGTALPIGDPFPTRRVILMALSGGHSGRTQVSQTIGGIAADLHFEVSGPSNEWACFISAIVPEGTTADISMTASSTLFGGGDGYIYVVDDRALRSRTPSTASASTAGGTSLAPSLAVKAGGIIIGGTRWGNGTGKTPISPTGFRSDYNTSAQQAFSYSQYPDEITITPTTSWTGSYSAVSAVVCWR